MLVKEQGRMHMLVFVSERSRVCTHTYICRQTFSRSWDALAVVQPSACSRGFASFCIWVWVEIFAHFPAIVLSARAIPLFEQDLDQWQF